MTLESSFSGTAAICGYKEKEKLKLAICDSGDSISFGGQSHDDSLCKKAGWSPDVECELSILTALTASWRCESDIFT